MQRRTIMVLAIVLSMLTVGSTAYALDDDVTEVVIDGAGRLAAHGKGKVVIHGSGWVKIKMRHGNIEIIDHAGDATIRVRPSDEPAEAVDDTTVVLEDFVGVIVVRGSDFTIKARGKFRKILATGRGTAFLKGRGWYRATGGYYGTWTPGGVRVIYAL